MDESAVIQFKNNFGRVRAEVGKVIVGHQDIVDGVLICLLSGGHALLEGVPGLGKTLLVRTLAEVLDLTFNRVQFTPDLMPADITGTNILMENAEGRKIFQFQRGPVFAQIVLADEINRATPKTQSAMLEAMQEHAVTVAGVQHRLEEPFFVLATQNPIEMEGTYPLPEAQMDRFLFKLIVPSPTLAELSAILDRTTGTETPTVNKVLTGPEVMMMRQVAREVPVASHVREYAVRIILATHPRSETAPDITNQFVRFGASPRGAQALIKAAKIRALLDGRYNVAFDDISAVAPAALRHRIILNFEGEAEGIGTDAVIREILNKLTAQIARVQA
ncbi:ATPase AAA [Capsulimonas corticalis]|uniref:ATPase AAA n=1 Tax=Capsulimonas corticalis TaxID=2219043 RepID=A0A402CRA3_9BACT|nr:MoxR family ATPase [Capsulimonas corticalis]BDI34513.1 ATPase AAA [Capsulimonas corticalis]